MLFLVLVILLPIIPAFIFYKIIPNQETDVQGTFASIKFKITGAFGGYFLLFIILLYFFIEKIDTDKLEVWTLKGQIEFAEGSGSIHFVEVSDPDNFKPEQDSLSKIYVIIKKDNGGELIYPEISVQHEQYQGAYIKFSAKDKVDKKNRTILLHNKIILKKDVQDEKE